MHINDLKMDVDLDGAALAAIRGGYSVLAGEQPQYPELPTFGGDWTKLNADIESYIGSVKSGAGFPEIDIAAPTVPDKPVIGADPLGGPF